MEQLSKDRFFTMAEAYDKMAGYLVPKYHFMQNEVLNFVKLTEDKEIVVVDLGAGSGIFLEKVLQRYPKAFCYWIDYSDDFLRVAKERLKKYNNRVQFILSPIEQNWEKQIKYIPDFIFSMSAIHHLSTEEKKELYKRCYDLLSKNGWFVNADEMKTPDEDAYINTLLLWADYVNQPEISIPDDLIDYQTKWNSQFDNWKLRNIQNFNIPKQKGDDLHESFIEQLKWLQEIGYKQTDVFLKYHLWSIIGGRKI